MNVRTLGDLTVSEIGLGCHGLADFYGTSEQDDAVRLIQAAIAAGVTLIDATGAEALVGLAIREVRDRITLISRADCAPSQLRATCLQMLEQLGTDHLDLLFLDHDDLNIPTDEAANALARLQAEGLVRHIGLSGVTLEGLRSAHHLHRLTAVEAPLSIGQRQPELVQFCRELGIGLVAIEPLGAVHVEHHLHAPMRHDDTYHHQETKELRNDQLGLMTTLVRLGAAKAKTPSQIALAWALAQGDFVVPIVATKRQHYLEENLAALDITLSASELAAIDAASGR